jgi:NADH-quinone oxidoreductase subunit G
MSDELVTLTIDEKDVSVRPGTLVVDAADELGIEIPVFCSHPKLDPVACCRMCLVEIDGPRGAMLMTACSVPVREGMVVRTDTEQVKATQEANLAFILLNHPLDCPICDKGGECPLQDQAMRFGPGISELVEPKRHKKKHHHISDTIVLDQERCVVCWRCIRYLEEWEDKPQLGLFQRGGETLIDIQPGQPVDAKTGGNIIDICPVGALTGQVSRFAYRPWQIDRTPSIDPHFPLGDNIRIDTRTYKIRRIVGRENMGVNDQWIADKTRFAYEWVNSEDRLTMPLVRKDGQLQPASWSEALQTVADRLREIKERSGADAVGAIGSAKLSNESNYLLQRFMRQIIGSNNVDHRDGGDVAALPTGVPALAGLMKPQYGPNPQHDVIMLFGVDPSEEAPVLDVHLKRAVRRGGAKLIIAHPRKVELTRYKGPYLGYKPGTEALLINGLTRLALAASGKKNSEVAALVTGSSKDALHKVCSVDADVVEEAAKLLAQAENPLIVYGPLVAQGDAGTQVRNGLTNLAGVIDHYENLAYLGVDANSQGCRDVGLLPDALPGHAALEDEEARARMEALWGGSIPTAAGKTYKQMLDSAGSDIQAMIIMGADPASERPEWATKLAQLDLLVVQELFLTETAQAADVVLPAVSWAEGDGTFTNCERRVQRAPKAVENPHSKAAQDWMILDHMAARMGVQWPYASAQGVLEEITKAAPIYAGLDWTALGDQGVQWDADAARVELAYRSCEQFEQPDAADDELLLVGGTVAYDAGNLFSLTTVMRNQARGAVVGLNPDDAARLDLPHQAEVMVQSDSGELALAVQIDERVRPGTVWIPESLPDAPVGALLNGRAVERVRIFARG